MNISREEAKCQADIKRKFLYSKDWHLQEIEKVILIAIGRGEKFTSMSIKTRFLSPNDIDEIKAELVSKGFKFTWNDNCCQQLSIFWDVVEDVEWNRIFPLKIKWEDWQP